jgi:serine/threonine-protein kinase
VGVGVLLALLVGGWLAYGAINDRLSKSETVAVPYVVGIQEDQAVNLIQNAGLVPNVRRASNSDVPEGTVFGQNPTEGTKVDKDTIVRIDVSSGKPQVTVPSVVGESLQNAVAELTHAGLDAQVVEVNSDKDEGTVTGQNPDGGTVVVEGTQVRINVSKGPKPLTVPNVVNLPYDQAAAELQRIGFEVSRIDVDSELAAGVVTAQDPNGGSQASRGSSVTLSVSKGPSTSAVPDVTGQDYAIAQTTLENAGFRTRFVYEDTTDQTMDGIVVSQDPIGGSQEKKNTLVTLFVGRYTPDQTTTDTAPTPGQ